MADRPPAGSRQGRHAQMNAEENPNVRVDIPSASTPLGQDLDPLAQAKQALRALRRKWYVLLAFVLVGMSVSWLSAPSTVDSVVLQKKEKEYFRATQTLILESNTDSASSTNIAQAAYLVSAGEIPARVAKELDLEVDEVERSVLGVPRQDVSSVEVQVIGTDRAKTARVADTTAVQLLIYLEEQAKTQLEDTTNTLLADLAGIEQDLSEINVKIAANPADLVTLEAQQRSLANQYSLTYERFAQLANNPTTESGLRSLGGAKTKVISEDTYTQVRDQIAEGLPVTTPTTVPGTETTSGSTANDEPEPTDLKTRVILGGLLGLVAGVLLILGLDRFDSRLRRRDDVEAVTGLPVMAEIPPLPRRGKHEHEVIAAVQPRSSWAEAYRVVRGAIMFRSAVAGDQRAQGLTIMVTSGNPAEGKTTTVANLAAVFAEGGLNVLVVNCDFRRPQMTKYLVAESQDTLNIDNSRLGAVIVASTQIERVRLVTGIGEGDTNTNPLEVVAMQRKIVQMARARFDIILLDTAPFLTTNDASELLSEVDEVVVVVRAGKTRRLAAHRTVDVLGRFDAPIAGIVLNDSNEEAANQYYYAYLDQAEKRSGVARLVPSAAAGVEDSP